MDPDRRKDDDKSYLASGWWIISRFFRCPGKKRFDVHFYVAEEKGNTQYCCGNYLNKIAATTGVDIQ